MVSPHMVFLAEGTRLCELRLSDKRQRGPACPQIGMLDTFLLSHRYRTLRFNKQRSAEMAY